MRQSYWYEVAGGVVLSRLPLGKARRERLAAARQSEAAERAIEQQKAATIEELTAKPLSVLRQISALSDDKLQTMLKPQPKPIGGEVKRIG